MWSEGFFCLVRVCDQARYKIDQEVGHATVAGVFDLREVLELVVHSLNQGTLAVLVTLTTVRKRCLVSQPLHRTQVEEGVSAQRSRRRMFSSIEHFILVLLAPPGEMTTPHSAGRAGGDVAYHCMV